MPVCLALIHRRVSPGVSPVWAPCIKPAHPLPTARAPHTGRVPPPPPPPTCVSPQPPSPFRPKLVGQSCFENQSMFTHPCLAFLWFSLSFYPVLLLLSLSLSFSFLPLTLFFFLCLVKCVVSKLISGTQVKCPGAGLASLCTFPSLIPTRVLQACHTTGL